MNVLGFVQVLGKEAAEETDTDPTVLLGLYFQHFSSEKVYLGLVRITEWKQGNF